MQRNTNKRKRSYNCLVLEKKDEYLICIQFRSEINHKHAFLFKNTNRSKTHKSGLDYTKIVLIKETEYIGSNGLVDYDEYVEMMRNIKQISKEVNNYIDGYIKYVKENQHENRKMKRYKYTTLKYFHDILNI